MAFLERAGYRLHWEQSGSGSPVLLIMGAVYSSELWYPALPPLESRHQVIRFDNQGTGTSTFAASTTIDDMAYDALAVLDAAGVETAHVYGLSLGGVVALELALAAPERVRSLVLGCTCVLTPDKPRAPVEATEGLRLATREQLVAVTTYGSACSPDNRARNNQAILEDTASGDALVAQQDALRAYSGDLSAVSKLTMPALVLHGTEDPIVPVEWGRELADALPDSRWVAYEGAGHNYLAELPEQANREVLDFLAAADSSVPAS